MMSLKNQNKNLPGLQFSSTDHLSLLSTPFRIRRTVPLTWWYFDLNHFTSICRLCSDFSARFSSCLYQDSYPHFCWNICPPCLHQHGCSRVSITSTWLSPCLHQHACFRFSITMVISVPPSERLCPCLHRHDCSRASISIVVPILHQY